MSSTGEISDQLTNLAAPLSAATITVRVIKSFEYRTEKSLVLHGLDLEHTTVGELEERVRNGGCLFLFQIGLESIHGWIFSGQYRIWVEGLSDGSAW